MKGTLHILDNSGHKTMEWDTEAKAKKLRKLDPADAEREFNRLVKQGWLGFGTTVEGDHEQIKKFDAELPKVTLSPQFVGG